MNDFLSHIFSPTRFELQQEREEILTAVERLKSLIAEESRKIQEEHAGYKSDLRTVYEDLRNSIGGIEKTDRELGQACTEALQKLKAQIESLEKKDGELGQACAEALQKLGAQIEGLEKKDGEIRERSDEILQRVEALTGMYSKLPERMDGANAKLDGITGILLALNAREFPLDVRFEREYYRGFPCCAASENDSFQRDILNLVRGLDEESIRTVVLQMRRLKVIMESNDPFISFYNTTEKDAMRKISEGLYSNILTLSENWYMYYPYMLPVNHFEPVVFVDKLMLSELEHPDRLSDKDIIDAGAYIGDSALVLSPVTSGAVYAFEPMPENYDFMLRTIEMNGLHNVLPMQLALGEQTGKTVFLASDSASTQFENSVFTYTGKFETDVVRLDDFVKEHDLRVGLIKADIEGAESMMLRGAVETIKTQKPAMLISIYHNAKDYFGIKPWLESLDLGYKFKIRHSVGGTVMTETVLIAEA